MDQTFPRSVVVFVQRAQECGKILLVAAINRDGPKGRIGIAQFPYLHQQACMAIEIQHLLDRIHATSVQIRL
jgi:hypothetical protein